MRISISALAALPLSLFAVAAAANWSSCGGNLASAQRYARDAEALSRELDKLDRDVDSAKRDYELCMGLPKAPDRANVDCSVEQLAYQTKLNEFDSKHSRLDAEINALLQRVTAAINDCR